MRSATVLVSIIFYAATSFGSELELQRSFKLPALPGIQFRQFTFNNSYGPPAYRPDGNTLVVRGHPNFPECADVTIPETDGAVATVRGWYDPSAGLDAALTAATPGTQGYNLRALVIDELDNSYGLMCEFYNVSNVNRPQFFRGDTTLGGYVGPWNGGQHSLKFAEYFGPLPYDLRKHFGVRWGGGNSTPQGTGTSNQGPSLYVFDWPEKSFPAGGVFPSTPVIEYPIASKYPGWYPTNLIRSVVFLPDEVWWIGRKGVGDNWYGVGTNFTLPDGRVVSDPVYSTAKGYHSSGYAPYAWRCRNSTIIAGAPVITETDLSTGYGLTLGKGSELSACYDIRGRRVFILDPKSDADRPMVRVYQVR